MRAKKTIERWFPVPNDPDNGEVLIKHLGSGELIKISEKTNQTETRYSASEDGKFKPDMVIKSDTSGHSDMLIDAAVVDWKNFFDADGNAMDCTRENKIKAKVEIDGFAELVTECRGRLAEDVQAEELAAEKN